MNYNVFGLVIGAAVLLSSPASALSLNNLDQATHVVEITTGDGEVETIELNDGQDLYDICNEGCFIRLDDGAEMGFDGTETVSIQNGEFVIAE